MPAEVADCERVLAPPGERVDLLEVLEVHDDAPEIAGEAHLAPHGGHVERLGLVLPLEEQRVAAGPAVDVVAAVARRPAEAVEVALEARDVVAPAAEGVVEAAAPDQQVVAGPAAEGAAAGAAVEGEPHGVGRRAEVVAAAATVDGQAVGGLGVLEAHEGGTEHGHGTREAVDRDAVVFPGAAHAGSVGFPIRRAEVGIDLEGVGRVKGVDGDAVRAALGDETSDFDSVELDRLTAPPAGQANAVPGG